MILRLPQRFVVSIKNILTFVRAYKMPVNNLLSRLQKVKPKGKGQWIACCPAHEDKSPSMTIAQADDGRVLVHCFAGCSTEQILSSVSLTFDDLYPPRALDHVKSSRPYIGRAVIDAIAYEALLVVVAANMLAKGEPLTEHDRQRLITAASRIQGAVNVTA